MSQDLRGQILPFSVEQQELLSLMKNTQFEGITFVLISTTKAIDRALWQARSDHRFWWDVCLDLLKPAIAFYGKEKVEVEIGLGLGETEEQVMTMVQYLKDLGAKCLIRPEVDLNRFNGLDKDYPRQKVSAGKIYRTLVGNHLIATELSRFHHFQFNEFGQILSFGMPYEELLEKIPWTELFPEEGPIRNPSEVLGEVFKLDFVEAWETARRRIDLEGISFDEAEIEEESGSIYQMIARLGAAQC